MLINAFGIAAAIAILGACLCVQISIILVREVRKLYNTYLIGQKQLAITMRQSNANKSKPTLDLSQLLSEFEGIKTIYEKRGLFSTEFVHNAADYIERESLTFKFSLY